VREVTQWLDEHPEDRPLMDDPQFVQRAANEAMRLNPPTPAVYRRAARSTELEGSRSPLAQK